MSEVRVLEHIHDVDEAAWNELVGPEDTPFVDWRWLAALEETGCVRAEVGWLPCHLAAYEDGRLVAAAPAYLKGNSEGEFVFDWRFAELAARFGVAYYPKLVLAVPFTPATGTRFLVAKGFDRERATKLLGAAAIELAKSANASSVHALFLTESEVNALAGLGFRERHGLQYHWHRRGAQSFEAFLGRLPTKKRTQLRRERRRPAESGIEVRTLESDEYTPAMARTMHRFYLSTVDKFMWGRRYLNPSFFERVAERFRDRLAWVVATRGAKPIAGAFNIASETTLYGRYWGADEELPFLHFNVCYYHGIDECLRRGLATFEPGAGGEHKHARGFDATVTRSAHLVFEPRLRGLMERYFDDERAAISQHLEHGADED